MSSSFDDDQLIAIKKSVSVSSVAGKFTQLKILSPGKYKGLCPLHSEKTPSFHVDDNTGYVHCFGCGLNLNVIDLTMALEGVGFKEAVTQLKIDAGIEDVYMTKSQRRDFEVARKRHLQVQNAFRQWKKKLRSDLIMYTNAQWRMYRIASKQSLIASSEELEDQIALHHREATRREAALDELDGLSDQELIEWFQSKHTWEGVKNPVWFLSGWRLKMAREGVAA